MATFDLNMITENASRLGMRLQETISEHTRDLAISRGSGLTYLDSSEEKVKNVRKQLDSNSDREKLEAMKRLIALISKGRNVSEYFAQVVKNVASHNLEIRKLVYIYLLRYAEQEPDLALLSINTFQKDLSDPNPLIRAMALRVLSGIRVPMIGNIVVLGIKKCAADISPYVRKAAALAIPKCYSLDSMHQPELITVITTLLRDRSPLSIGSVSVAFEAVCPTRLDLLHPHYRRLCRTLIDVDEWGQVDLLNLLIRYARTMLPRPVETVHESGKTIVEVDADLKLLLTSAEPLFQSQNPAVVLAVARTFWYLSPSTETSKIVPPLLRLLNASAAVQRVVLAYLVLVAEPLSQALAPFYSRFLVRAGDIRQAKKDKVRLLRAVISVDTYQALLREFVTYAEDTDDELVADAIQAIGYCARIVPDSTQQCLASLMSFIQSKHDVVVANAVIVLKSLVQLRLQQQTALSVAGSSASTSPLAIISHLAYHIDEIRHPKARACVLWLVGQYASTPSAQENGVNERGPEGVAEWAPDVLRKSAKSFMSETPLVKLQIITLAAKLLVLCPTHGTLGLLARYVFSLARYDQDLDVRDRARFLSSMLAGIAPNLRAGDEDEPLEDAGGVVLRREQVRLVLFEGKFGISDEPRTEDRTAFGSLKAITGKTFGDSYLPDWLEEGIEPSLRDSEDDVPQVSVHAQASQPRAMGAPKATPIVLTPTGPSPSSSYVRPEGYKSSWTDLDTFYDDANDGEVEDAESESEESENDVESGEEEEEEGGEEDEDESEDESGTEELDNGTDSGNEVHTTQHAT